MSFSRDIKLEILENRPPRAKTGGAFLYGMFLSATCYSPEEVTLVTGVSEVADRFASGLRWICGKGTGISTAEEKRRGRSLWRVSLPDGSARMKLMERYPPGAIAAGTLLQSEDIHAFLAGFFLSCGSVTAPQKAYRMDFVLDNPALALEIAALIDSCALSAHIATRRGRHVVYCKGVTQIEDILIMMGATRASLAIIDVEMIKEVRNRANRATNCETANIDKQVGAAAGQINDINLIFDVVGEETLSDMLKETARLRLEHPDASLRELIALSPTPVSRSGMHHRLASLSRMAEQIREEQNKSEVEQEVRDD